MTDLRAHRGLISACLHIAARVAFVAVLAPMAVLKYLVPIPSEVFLAVACGIIAFSCFTMLVCWMNSNAIDACSSKMDGEAALRVRDYRKADSHFRTALQTAESLAEDDPIRGEILALLATTARLLGNYGDAEYFARRALGAQESAWGPHDRRTIAAQDFLVRLRVESSERS